MSVSNKNKKYLRDIAAQISRIPREAAIEVAIELFDRLVQYTAVDTGQAVLNWKIQAYTGTPNYQPQQMFWGYTLGGQTIQPTAPAGYKWNRGDNALLIKAFAVEQATRIAYELKGSTFDGISVYNPITPGFAGFAPGDDSNYEQNALGSAYGVVEGIKAQARIAGYFRIASRYSFVKVGGG